MKISAQRRVLDRAVGELARQRVFSSADLRRVRSRALRAASRACAAETALRDDLRASLGFSSRNSPSLAVDDRRDEALHARVAELGLRLALELRVLELRGDDRGEALADVLAGEVLVLLLEQALARARSG